MWSDDYTHAVYVIITQMLLGLYSTRTNKWANVPSGMLSEEDYIEVELVRSPHEDPDGTPNFYSFESFVPKFILDTAIVPMYTCFYGSLRALATDYEARRLGGVFEDSLNDPKVNTWDAVLRPGQSMRDWVMSFYDSSYTWDGSPLWPKQMTDFSTYFKNDEWDDQLEHAIAFHLIGAHRLEVGSWKFENVSGFDHVTPTYRLPLNDFANIQVRPGMGRFGVDLYFNEQGLPVLLVTTDKEVVVRGDPKWQYWKFVWRSTLVTGITLVDHLHLTHYRASTILSRAVRVGLQPDHPVRRVLSIFTFGGIFINAQAMHVLLGPNHLLHRASPFKDFAGLSDIVPKSNHDVTEVPAIERIANDKEWDKLNPKLKELPFYADGRLLMLALRKMIYKFMDLSWPVVCPKGTWASNFTDFVKDMGKFTLESHYQVSKDMLGFVNEAILFKDCTKFRELLTNRLVHYVYIVTAWHRHVGFVGDYYADPSLTTMSWKDGEPFGRPRQHMIMSVINVFTSTQQPLLKSDYTHLFKNMRPDLETEYTKVWKDFMEDLHEIEAEINVRNKGRKIKNVNHSPQVLECSVSK